MNGKVIHLESCKKLKFDHKTKWYKRKSESALVNETKNNNGIKEKRAIIIPDRIPDLIMIKKKKKICQLVSFPLSADGMVKIKENNKGDKYLDFASDLRKLWHLNVTVRAIVDGALLTVPPKIGKTTGRVGNMRTHRDNSGNSIDDLDQNTEKSS